MPPKKAAPKKTQRSEAIDVDAPAAKKDPFAIMMGKDKPAARADWPELFPALKDDKWTEVLLPLMGTPQFRNVEAVLAAERDKKEIFPPTAQVFSAFDACPWDKLKVVLIGQDPYHDNGQAHGLCFSVMPGVKTPPSLVNMYKELRTDVEGFTAPPHGYLQSWAEQGILMLNATLTVEAHQANSHSKIGWQAFTDDVIKKINAEKSGVVFLLWGGFAQKKAKMIDVKKHRIVAAAHPSPLSFKSWNGCRTFSRCNAALAEVGQTPIDWTLPQEAPKVE